MPAGMDPKKSVEQVAALLSPRNVIIVGASDKAGNWTPRVQKNLKRYKFPGAIYPMNPGRDEVWGEKCYRDFASLPEAPDHLLILVPAVFVPGVLREAALAGARSATIMTSGFEESGSDEGRKLGVELRRAIAETGMAVSGPNCFGNLIAARSFVTLPDDRPQQVAPGPVAIVGQSGGIATAIKRTLEERGIIVGALVTSGNEAGLNTADYIHYFAADPATKVIVCYLESIRDRDSFLAACRAARAAGKPVVVAKLGTSNAGRAAALAHTGALAGSAAAFDAVAGAAGALRVRTLDDVVEVVEYLLHAPLPKGPGLGAITLSGGLRGLLLDAAERNGMVFATLQPETQAKLEDYMGAGSAVGNPLDGGYTVLSSQANYLKSIEIMLSDPGVDLLLMQEELPREAGSARKESNLREAEKLASRVGKPICYVSMISYGLNEYARTLHAELPHLPFLQEADKAMRAVSQMTDHVANISTVDGAVAPPAAAQEIIAKLRTASAGAREPFTLSEPDSKALLAAYGVSLTRETLTESAEAAVQAADSIGYPVVLKGVSADLPHKTEAGAVLVGLKDAKAVRAGYAEIIANVAKAKPGLVLDGVLVAEMVSGGIELALGIANDPEVGPVVMFGGGGIALELYGDVAFAAPGADRAWAARLINQTKAASLLDGWRRTPAHDRAAVEAALIAVGRIAQDLGDVFEALDVNPFIARGDGKGGVALDALVVLRAGAPQDT
jgi:acetate---CoA ligase (ADP-forming)